MIPSTPFPGDGNLLAETSFPAATSPASRRECFNRGGVMGTLGAEGPTLPAKWKSEAHRRLEEASAGTSVPRDAGKAIVDALGSLT